MKIINIGLSILVSLVLAISPIQASETDVADEATLTIHYNGETYIEKVPVNEWMMFMDDYCVIDGKTYYSGQSLKFTKDTDVYLKESTSLSNVYVSHKDLTKLTGNGYGWVRVNCFIKWHDYNYNVKEDPGKEVNLELD